ncbi:MAG: TMEM175 family protein [Thermomicrobiales bacterium]
MSTNAEELAEQRDTIRLEAFSDAVIAIVATLLVIEIHVPEVGEGESLWRELGHLWPSYLAFFISFTIIGIMWINHHNLFKRISRVDHYLLVINLLLLLMIAFIPFTTALVAEHLTDDWNRTSALVYSGWFLLTAAVYNLFWWYAAHEGKLLSPGTSAGAIQAITRSYQLGLAGYAFAFLLAFVIPLASLIVLLLLAAFFILPRASAG